MQGRGLLGTHTPHIQRNKPSCLYLKNEFFIHAYEWKNKLPQTFEEKQWLSREVPRLNEIEPTMDEAKIPETEGIPRKQILINSSERFKIIIYNNKSEIWPNSRTTVQRTTLCHDLYDTHWRQASHGECDAIGWGQDGTTAP